MADDGRAEVGLPRAGEREARPLKGAGPELFRSWSDLALLALDVDMRGRLAMMSCDLHQGSWSEPVCM